MVKIFPLDKLYILGAYNIQPENRLMPKIDATFLTSPSPARFKM